MPSSLARRLPDWPLELVKSRLSEHHNGDFPRWQVALDELPVMQVESTEFASRISIQGQVDDAAVHAALQRLHPWRKGPFQVGATHIDTEWRSDWKWQRLADAVEPRLRGRVLDIGCGNGYFGWRMLNAGAAEVIGIDPSVLFCMQHLAIQHFIDDPRNQVLPLRIEELPSTVQFDAVFSMGVIYHRRDQAAHVRQIFELTADDGFAVLESLVTEDANDMVPRERYARMRNVWRVPSVQHLVGLMQNAGFSNVNVVDVTTTTTSEQRTTPWMRFESLQEALDPADPTRTVEGYPAPVRATLIGEKNQA